MRGDPLERPCPHCNGTGTIYLTPALVGTYGMALLRAMHAIAWDRSGDLPLHASGNLPTRLMALKRLVRLGLAEKRQAAADSGGLEYEWRLTAAGRTLAVRDDLKGGA